MKLHFNSLIKCAAAVFCGASLFACNDLSELEDRVDSLDSRITALENQLPALQENIDAVQALFDGKVFITAISTNDTGDTGDEYTLTMSDGKTYTIKQGKIGNTPQIAVKDGYWIVSYDNEATFRQRGYIQPDKGQRQGCTCDSRPYVQSRCRRKLGNQY